MTFYTAGPVGPHDLSYDASAPQLASLPPTDNSALWFVLPTLNLTGYLSFIVAYTPPSGPDSGGGSGLVHSNYDGGVNTDGTAAALARSCRRLYLPTGPAQTGNTLQQYPVPAAGWYPRSTASPVPLGATAREVVVCGRCLATGATAS